MDFAVIQTGGKQYIARPGETLTIEKIPAKKEGENIVFDKVLLVADEKGVHVGNPYIEGVKITATHEGSTRGKKVNVLKYKSKIRYHIQRGHRQEYAQVRISGEGTGKKASPRAKQTQKKKEA